MFIYNAYESVKLNPTFIFEVRLRTPLASINQIELVVAVPIDKVSARKFIRVLTYRFFNIGPSKYL